MPWGPDGREAAVTLSFDNLGEVSDLGRGRWPEDEPLGRHFTVTSALPRIEEVLADAGVRATFFVEGRNAELYPGTLVGLVGAGHEVALHGWCHEPWHALSPEREAELLERSRRAMAEVGVRLAGFRPPGGRLTAASPALLREHGFTYCSPAGTGTGLHDGLLALPFRWTLVDAYYSLPRFGALRERDSGSSAALPPQAFARALDAALDEVCERGGHLVVLFHPFLLDDAERLDVLRGFVAGVRRREDAGTVWSAPVVEVAEWLRDVQAGPADLRLDPTPA